MYSADTLMLMTHSPETGVKNRRRFSGLRVIGITDAVVEQCARERVASIIDY